MKSLREVFIFTFGCLLVSMLLASVSHAVQAPREFVLGIPTPTGQVLGGACFSMDTGNEALPCNPAFISREVPVDFKADLLIGNNTQYLGDITTLLAGDGDSNTVHHLFSESRASEMDASIVGAYRRPTWGIAVMPYRILSYFFVRNSALPEVTLLAAQEQSIAGQVGGYLGDDWSWGVQIRAVQRRIISQTFSLTDALAEDGSSLYSPVMQNAFYVEPGLLKEWRDEWWSPQFTIAITQMGVTDKKAEDFPVSPELHVGGALRPPISIGVLQIGLDAYLNSQTSDLVDPLRLGVSYDVGMTRLMASAGESSFTAGFMLRYKDMTGGLMYDSQWIQNWYGEDEWVRTVSLHVGVEI